MILSLATNNPIEEAGEAKFKENVKSYQAELTLWLSKEYVKLDGNLKVDSVNATYESGEYNGLKIQDIITNLSDKIGGYTEDATKFSIVKGELIYSKQDNETEKEWAKEAGISDGSVPNIKPTVPIYNTGKGVNRPQLATGMIPVKWNGATSKWDEVVDPDIDDSWYDYSTKQWANAKTADGSMWVWIPRYVYKISSMWHQTSAGVGEIELQFSKEYEDDWNKELIGLIDRGTTAAASNKKWTYHPAFTFGGKELAGFWIAKYEASSVEGNGNTVALDNVSNKTIQIQPNVASWRNIRMNNAFYNCLNMKENPVYGLDKTKVDTHLTKNVEWGAVAYLTHSKYGVYKTEITPNKVASFVTAGGDFIANTNQTTTGTIYGVYDMSAGAYDLVAANYNYIVDSLNGITAQEMKADKAKYWDIYTGANYGYNNLIKGDAIYETSLGQYYTGSSYSGNINGTWFQDHSRMTSPDLQWIMRGLRAGTNNSATEAGIFSFNATRNDPNICSFRPVLVYQ